MATPESTERSDGSLFGKLRRRAALRGQAKEDYQRARGTSHLKLLRKAQSGLQRELQRAARTHQAAEHARKEELESRDLALTKALIRHLVRDELSQIPGIGPTLHAKLIRYVYRGRLNDLHHAQRLDGIGPHRQYQISAWVHRIERDLPHMLKEDFPGKTEIVESHQEELDKWWDQMNASEEKMSELRALKQKIDAAVSELNAVTWHDFYDALAESVETPEKVRRYVLGVFAAWEPVPDWFQEALTLGEK